jgi:hypothetical protein
MNIGFYLNFSHKTYFWTNHVRNFLLFVGIKDFR